ncbi:MAG: hypothetical protein M0C28_26250, partial [Candidatus Moduliflexus flocculans]|nr:hypothetical protein [Candidatus Moduliflexus flocculans]
PSVSTGRSTAASTASVSGRPRTVSCGASNSARATASSRAADDGELTFAAEGRRLPGGYPLAGGSLLVVAHASDMATIYSGMQPGAISAYLRNVRRETCSAGLSTHVPAGASPSTPSTPGNGATSTR